MVADGVMGVMDQFGELFFGPKQPEMTCPFDGTTNTTPEATFGADNYYYSSSLPWRATSSSYIPKQTLDHQIARKKKLAKYKLERERSKAARQQEQQMIFHQLQEDFISDTTPYACNHRGGDDDNGDDDDDDDDFVYVRLRKSDLLLTKPVQSVSLSRRIDATYDQTSDRKEFQSVAKPARLGTVHRDRMQRFIAPSSFSARQRDPEVDLAPVLHDLGCGFGPLPTSSSSRKNYPIKNVVSKIPSPTDSGGDRDLTAVLDRVEQMRNRRQHDKAKKQEKSTKKQIAKKSARASNRSSSLPSSQYLLWDRLDKLEKEIRAYKTSRAHSFKRRFDELAGQLQEEDDDQQQYGNSQSHPSDHSLDQRLQRLEREVMMAKRYPPSQRQVVAAERFSPPKSYGSHYPPSQSSRVSKRSRVGTSWLDDLQSDFVRRMQLDEYDHEDYHQEKSCSSDSQEEDSPTTQLKDSLAKAHETFHDKSALHRETFQSIGKVRRSIHRNSAYKEEMLERESRGEGGEIRDIVEGRRETVGNRYASSIGANARPVYSVQKIVPQMAPPDARRYTEVSKRHPEEKRTKTTMSTTRVIIPEFLDPRKKPRRIHIPDRYSVLGTRDDDDDE
jgi:hypothetical protein